jgi:transcriptional regulator with XRE-family HTH domain
MEGIMKILEELFKELGISKVKLAKYLNVSRQMVYNYLEMNNVDEWPKDKKLKLFLLLDIQEFDDIKNIKPNNEYISRLDKLLNESDDEFSFPYSSNKYDLKELSKKQQKMLFEIIELIKELLSEDENGTSYSTCRYLYNFLQVIDDVEELKYILAYFSKINGFIPVTEFVYNEENQTNFESIIYQAISLFNSGGASKSRLLEVHKKFQADIEQRQEEKLSRTQELNTVKLQALRELGYNDINEKNSTEVFEKIAEIQSRKI